MTRRILAVSVTVLVSIFAVVAGLAFGSFLNVCISRLPRHESIVAPRSRCPHCGSPIRAWDNIPLLSWFLLQGRCRDCDHPISARYPAIESASAALFLLCFLHFGLDVRGLGSAIFCWLLLGLAATDAEAMLLPDTLTIPGLLFGVLYSGLSAGRDLFSWKAAGWSVLWAIGAAALILLVRWIYWLVRRREGLGRGDAKLLAMIAAWIGVAPTALVLFLGVILAALYGLILGRRRKPEERSELRIPLGAFLCAAAIFSLFHGDQLLKWYFHFFL